MSQIIIFLISFCLADAIQILPNFYNVQIEEPIEVQSNPLTSAELDELQLILDLLSVDQGAASEYVEGFLIHLGFKVEKMNQMPPYNFLLTKISGKYILKNYLNKVLQLNGKIVLVFDEPLESTISKATPESIRLDPRRFLMSLLQPFGVIPHEVMHFAHLQEVKKGSVQPHHSALSNKEPLLATYKNGFNLDEIEAHLGDAYLMKFRGEIPGESFLNSQGKASLVYLMLDQVQLALDTITASIKKDQKQYFSQNLYIRSSSETFGRPVTEIYLSYLNRSEEMSIFQMLSIKATENMSDVEILNLIEIHRKWVSENFQKLDRDFKIKDLTGAQNTIKEQAGPLL